MPDIPFLIRSDISRRKPKEMSERRRKMKIPDFRPLIRTVLFCMVFTCFTKMTYDFILELVVIDKSTQIYRLMP